MSHKKEDRAIVFRSPFGFPYFEDDFFDIHSQTGLSISEDEDHIYVEAQLPGIKPEEIEVCTRLSTYCLKPL